MTQIASDIPKDKLFETEEETELRTRGYILGSTLGEGSYARVKSAYSEKLMKKVAIKIINRKKAPKDFQVKFLPREIENMKKLKHTHIIQLHEILEFNHKVYIIMEYAGHGDLLDYVKLRGPLGEEKSGEFFIQIIDAMRHCHKSHIVHRDLKCENLLLDATNNVKVSDFGFSRGFEATDRSRTYCGSAAYAAPEILRGEPYFMPAYDIWSIGVILYIMLNGTMPYDDRNLKKMIKDQTEKKVGFSRKVTLSKPAKDMIWKILDPNVSSRATIDDIWNHEWVMEARKRKEAKQNASKDKEAKETSKEAHAKEAQQAKENNRSSLVKA